MKDVDLGVCGGHFFEGDGRRVAILLPGAYYLPAAPLLWFGREVLQSQGWSVLQVWDQLPVGVDRQQWVDERLDSALHFISGDPELLVLAKSLTSLAAPVVAAMGIPAIWLTPLLNRDSVRSGILAAKAPTLAVGGTADPTWDGGLVSPPSHLEVLEVLGADHGIQIPDDPVRSVEALGAVVGAMKRFVSGLGG